MSDEPKYRLTPLEEINEDYFISADYYECESGISVGELIFSIREICRQEIKDNRHAENCKPSSVSPHDYMIQNILKILRSLEERVTRLEDVNNEIHRVKPGHVEMQFCEKRINELEEK